MGEVGAGVVARVDFVDVVLPAVVCVLSVAIVVVDDERISCRAVCVCRAGEVRFEKPG